MNFDFSIIRDLRKNLNLSIQELSNLSSVSASVISKMERNQNSVEMETLYRIARVFGMTLTDLISLAENRVSHIVDEVSYTSGDFIFTKVSYGNLRCMRAVAQAGAQTSRPEIHRDDLELCWVLKGSLHFTLPNEQHTLCAGKSIQFDAQLPHTYKAIEDVELLIIHLRKGKRF
jgi:transcriptional regulator with XRE-family HTH domain